VRAPARDGGGGSLAAAVAAALRVVPDAAAWAFDEVRYLEAKNRADARARSSAVWRELERELRRARADGAADGGGGGGGDGGGTLRVLDVGAGLLAMLPRALALARGGRLEYTAFEASAVRARSRAAPRPRRRG